jgi:hypothetical protein
MESLQARGYIRTYLKNSLYFEGDVGFGRILDGKSQDSDYFGDNRTQEFSRSYADIKGDGTYDLSVGIGYQFGKKIDAEKGSGFLLVPRIGYALRSVNVRVNNGVQVVNTLSSFLGPFDGLDTTYNTKWEGPWIGLRGEFDFNHKVGLFIDAEYHIMDFEADADWNLRSDFAHPVSFEHFADADGGSISAGITFSPTNTFTLVVTASYSESNTDAGLDRTYFSDGTSLTTRLNEVEWKSASIMFTPIYRF